MTTDNNYLGCYAEQAFATQCTKLGFIVSKPFLDSSPYDLVVDDHKGLYRVQVKYTAKFPEYKRRSIHIALNNGKMKYNANTVDYFAIYSEHFNGFFIIPYSHNVQSFRLNPEGKYSDYFNKFVFK